MFPRDAAQRSMIDGVGQLGVLMLLLLTGMETDLELVSKVRRAAASVSMTGIAVPFLCGFLTGEFLLPDSLLPTPERRLVTALFLGTALSISSIKIVAMVVREMNFMRRDLGQVIIASAIIEDSIGWIVIAITFSLATQGKIDAGSLARSVGGTAIFLLASLTLGRPVVHALIRWANDRLMSELPVITVILVIMGSMALTTPSDRRAHRARRFRRRRADRGIADPHPPHRGSAARPDHGAVHADLLRACRIEHRHHDPEQSASSRWSRSASSSSPASANSPALSSAAKSAGSASANRWRSASP